LALYDSAGRGRGRYPIAERSLGEGGSAFASTEWRTTAIRSRLHAAVGKQGRVDGCPRQFQVVQRDRLVHNDHYDCPDRRHALD